MIGRQSGLGRGLGALIPPKPGAVKPALEAEMQTVVVDAPSTPSFEPSGASDTHESTTLRHIPLSRIVTNPHQPRRHFDHAAMEDLVSSIKEHGVIEPLVVTALPDGRYELIAGERRMRASQIAELETVPAIIRLASEQEKLELAIIENVQRQDLNPIEEALAYQRLMNEFGLTQDQVSTKVGKSRPQVANTVRLLQLPEEVQRALIERKISASNARTLLSLPSESARLELFRSMLAGQFTVRQTEARVPHPRKGTSSFVDPNIADVERQLREALGHRVDIKKSGNGSGEIRIGFESNEDLNEIVNRFNR